MNFRNLDVLLHEPVHKIHDGFVALGSSKIDGDVVLALNNMGIVENGLGLSHGKQPVKSLSHQKQALLLGKQIE